jgi:hypothetical protein
MNRCGSWRGGRCLIFDYDRGARSGVKERARRTSRRKRFGSILIENDRIHTIHMGAAAERIFVVFTGVCELQSLPNHIETHTISTHYDLRLVLHNNQSFHYLPHTSTHNKSIQLLVTGACCRMPTRFAISSMQPTPTKNHWKKDSLLHS